MPLPEGVQVMPPGPELAGVLASIGPRLLAGEDTVTYLQRCIGSGLMTMLRCCGRWWRWVFPGRRRARSG